MPSPLRRPVSAALPLILRRMSTSGDVTTTQGNHANDTFVLSNQKSWRSTNRTTMLNPLQGEEQEVTGAGKPDP
jgi:hypothetical protein